MGLMNSALQIGSSGLFSYQSALSVVGNNIANAADEDYTRQQAVLEPMQGATLPQGIKPGGGVALTSLQRIIDEALEGRLRDAISDVEELRQGGQVLTQVEQLFNELGNDNLSSMLGSLFNAFHDVQNDATDLGMRGILLGEAKALASTLQLRRGELAALLEGLGGQIATVTKQADEISEEIAHLNIEIVASESDGQAAGALRDQRDALLKDLSELIKISVRHQDSGAATVFVGNEILIQYGYSRGLTAEPVVDGDFVRYHVRFKDDAGDADVRGGLLAGLIALQDSQVIDIIANLDDLSAGLITGINEVHADGQGLVGYNALTSEYAVSDRDAPLSSSVLNPNTIPQTGSFFIAVEDSASGKTDAYQIDIDLDGVDADTSLTDLVNRINATVANVSASVTVDNRLTLSAEPGFTFHFGHDGAGGREDSSKVLAALGVNTLFSGSDASNIRVRTDLLNAPELLAAATIPLAGDGTNASRLADVRNQAHSLFGNVSLSEFYNQMIVSLGNGAAGARAQLESAESVLAALQAQRASISGVNLDEEAVNLLRYERAFQGSARFTSVVDELITEMLNILR